MNLVIREETEVVFSPEFVKSRSFDLSKDVLMPFEDEADEGREVKVRRRPNEPTKEERIKHRATHIPYRSWCVDCVAAAGRDHPHRRMHEEADARDLNEVHLDYCFPRDGEGMPSATVVVVKPRNTRAVFSHIVSRKRAGGMDWAVQQILRGLVRLGIHGKTF